MGLSELRDQVAVTDAELAQLRQHPGEGAALDEAAGRIAVLKTRRELLAGKIAEIEAAERAAQGERAARAAAQERQRIERDLQGRRDELSRRWAVWGQTMTEVDERARALWKEYQELASAALELGRDAAAANVEMSGPDTSSAHAVMAGILAGTSPVRDWRR